MAALLQWHLERGLRSLVMVDRGSADQHVSAASVLINASVIGAVRLPVS